MAVARSSRTDAARPRTGAEIRDAFLAFFEERGHKRMPSASLVPEDPTVLLTIAGMLPFKPIFLGQQERPAPCATSSQKCIRTNDIENVGRTARHHTFFEMLGNFSFGDYFKQQAIEWAWELSTGVFGLDPKNLVVSVFRDDDEAEQIWREVVGVNPKRIIRMDEEDNFWASGPTGPCGPCSEIYYDFKPELGDDGIDLEDDDRFIEFYNLVFMQSNRDAEGTLTPLANRNIDTGMGLERMAQILQKVPNNYETDLIFPLIQAAAERAGVDYHQLDEKGKTSLKVIGDHSRAVTQLISDGVTASNLGRGYILRRLLRRVVRHGRLLGIDKPFLQAMGEASIALMQSAHPQLSERREVILAELQREEARFLETLERGEKLLADVLAAKPKQISGEQAFELYDTYGFPLELTQEIAEEHGLAVDLAGFETAMEQQRQRAKAAAVSIDLTLQDAIDQVAAGLQDTEFRGYEQLEQSSSIQALVVNGEPAQSAVAGDAVQVVLDVTPFYGEGGGQIGDRGTLVADGQAGDGLIVMVESVSRNRSVFVHSGRVQRGALAVGDVVHGRVDRACRRRAQANHTATHLLQAALKQEVDPGIGQAGSLVSFDRLRFDFHCPRAVTAEELERIESLINGWIADAHALEVQEMAIEKAKAAGAVAMFGEKYADVVRVVDVPGVSMELCGGTHVANTAEIGLFKIVSESGVAAGIRRIEAVAGAAVLPYLNERDAVVKQLGERFKAQPGEIIERVTALQDELKATGKALAAAQAELAVAKSAALATKAVAVGDFQLLVERLDGVDGTGLQGAAQSLADQLGDGAAVVLGGLPDPADQGKVILVAAFGKAVIAQGQQAGKFIGGIAKLCGGGGGGRPNLAQAGGRDGAALASALEAASHQLRESL
ncbi:alanine--tRNA ligase [Synechococcus sp. CS-197]|uniref:Alanine--tRNA ligase n=1 Tax=Synechococcus sp. (strain WH7803) TaxID=32051 RepID=SYA_SYNPW|nr:alanine--tRNA ligase [Synechococcus sp. CS-197]A5GPF9.1 RecName: Full=Alanine--tRNA ligase; AltName: Full=Alanyl-tRNA synthetase; Short=AlaRS [Synechococcus sp. WH 7803]MCT0250984.1 alanine--tRNA ligase [Synechococcus sp. CS-197]CAK24824.1 Alanyl-tRNA synthetase [Synechococcus sp. WH 7803]